LALSPARRIGENADLMREVRPEAPHPAAVRGSRSRSANTPMRGVVASTIVERG
jgi:hypothetical protein